VAASLGAAATEAFLLLAGRCGGEEQIGAAEVADATGIAFQERRGEAAAGYRHYRGRGSFAGMTVAADLRAPRNPRITSPLLLVIDPRERLPLGIRLAEEYGPPDVTEPPGPHGPPDEPEYLGYRRGRALASIGVWDGKLVSLVLRVPA
jgi:hypothetical protein